MPEGNPAILLQDIERQYHQGEITLEILKGADLAVWAGQSVALMAPSGTGKSTLLHIAGLLEHADAGDVYINGLATARAPQQTISRGWNAGRTGQRVF